MRRTMISVLTLSLALVPATIDAQVARRAGPPAGRAAGNAAARVLGLPTVLGLTSAQVAQLEQIRERTKAQNQPLLGQLRAARSEIAGAGQRRGMIAARPGMAGRAMLAQRGRMAQLTAEQRATLRDSMRARMQSGQRGLQLTPEQRAARRDSMQARMQQRTQLTPEQRAQRQAQMQEQRTARRAQLEKLQPVLTQLRQNEENARREVEAVLTAEQLAKLRELRGAGRRGPSGR